MAHRSVLKSIEKEEHEEEEEFFMWRNALC